MTTEDLIRHAFIEHVAAGDQAPADFEAKLDWWNRGWLELAEAGTSNWTVTALGHRVLAGDAVPDPIERLRAALNAERSDLQVDRWAPADKSSG